MNTYINEMREWLLNMGYADPFAKDGSADAEARKEIERFDAGELTDEEKEIIGIKQNIRQMTHYENRADKYGRLMTECSKLKRSIEMRRYVMPKAIMGDGFSKDQSEKAKHSRGKITDDGLTIGDLIERLAQERDALGDYVPAPSLWEPLFAALDEAGASPKATRNNRLPRKSYYSYTNAKGMTATIQRDTFENKISAFRKKLSR
jgi:hypothetical protein